MFEVNIGLANTKPETSRQEAEKQIELAGQQIMQFADINADMFTDIIAIDKDKRKVIIHIFDPSSSNYTQKVTFTPIEDCNEITNIGVGRSAQTFRLFITCKDKINKTIMKVFDRNLNGELQEEKDMMKNGLT